jgi:hypothetical protein
MTDNVAILAGYTREIFGDCPEYSLVLLVKPETDLDGTFRAWCVDGQEFIHVNGWLFAFEDSNNG